VVRAAKGTARHALLLGFRHFAVFPGSQLPRRDETEMAPCIALSCKLGYLMNQRPLSVGVIANPSSGRDLRRLLSWASVFPTAEKVNVVLRLISAMGSLGVDERTA
jgi:hypothetical protein